LLDENCKIEASYGKVGGRAGQLCIENMADKLALAVFGLFFGMILGITGMFLIVVWPSLTD